MLVCTCALIPAAARADDGGWWEWLQGLSGPKLFGLGTEFHVRCLDKNGHPVFCEKLFGIIKRDVPFDDIRHEFDVRVSLYWNHGPRFQDVPDPVVNGDTPPKIFASKLMVLYYNRVSPRFSVGGGGGFLPFFSSPFADKYFDHFSRGIVTPVSVIFTPFKSGNRLVKAFYIRSEYSYITQGFTAPSFGSTLSQYSTGGEWNGTLTFGLDARRK